MTSIDFFLNGLLMVIMMNYISSFIIFIKRTWVSCGYTGFKGFMYSAVDGLLFIVKVILIISFPLVFAELIIQYTTLSPDSFMGFFVEALWGMSYVAFIFGAPWMLVAQWKNKKMNIVYGITAIGSLIPFIYWVV